MAAALPFLSKRRRTRIAGGGAPAALSLWDNTVHLFAWGQSNSLGRDDGTSLFSSYITPRIQVFNRGNGAFEPWNLAGAPQHDFPYVGGTGPSAGNFTLIWHLAHWITDNTSLNVKILIIARGERELADFASGGGLHTELLSQLAAARAYFPRMDLVGGHQGESDTGSTGTVDSYFDTGYPAYQSLIRGLDQAHANLPWIFGELAPANANKIYWNSRAAAYAAGALNTKLALLSDLPTIDGTHYTAAGGGTAGYERMAALLPGLYSIINAAATGTRPTASVTGLTATAFSESRIDLAWTDSADPSACGNIIRRFGNEIARVLPGVEQYSVTGLAAATPYDFTVSPLNRYGERESGVVSETTDAAAPVSLPTTDLLSRWTAAAGIYVDAGVTLATNGQTARERHDQYGTAGAAFKHLVQATSGLRSTYLTNIQNGKPVIRSDGTRRYAVGASVKGAEPFSMHWAGTFASIGADQCVMAMVNPANNQNYFALGINALGNPVLTVRGGATAYTVVCSGTVAAGVPCVISVRVLDETHARVALNGANEVNGTWAATGPTITDFSNAVLGRSSAIQFHVGDEFESLFYNVEQSDSEYAQSVAYLRYEWAF